MDGVVPQKPSQQSQAFPAAEPLLRNFPITLNPKTLPMNQNSIPLPVISLQNLGNSKQLFPPIISSTKTIFRTNLNSNITRPLTVNTGSPMYPLSPSPNTPNYSPVMSPAQRERIRSPYHTPQSLSPVGKFSQMYSPGRRLLSPNRVIHGGDPYLTNKMQPSPGFPLQPGDLVLDRGVSMPSPDFWGDTEMLSGTTELATALDDVQLV